MPNSHSCTNRDPRTMSFEVTEVTGRVRGKTAILGDDVIMTGRDDPRET